MQTSASSNSIATSSTNKKSELSDTSPEKLQQKKLKNDPKTLPETMSLIVEMRSAYSSLYEMYESINTRIIEFEKLQVVVEDGKNKMLKFTEDL